MLQLAEVRASHITDEGKGYPFQASLQFKSLKRSCNLAKTCQKWHHRNLDDLQCVGSDPM